MIDNCKIIQKGPHLFSWIKREVWSTEHGQIRFSIIPIDVEHWHGRGENFTEKKAVLGPDDNDFYTYILEKNIDGYWIELTSEEYESPAYKSIKERAEYDLWEWKALNPETAEADFGKTLFGMSKHPDYNFRKREDIENFDTELDSYLKIKDYDEFVETVDKIHSVLDEMTTHQKEHLKNLDEFWKLGYTLFFKKFPSFEKYAKHEVGKTYRDSMNRNVATSRQDAKKWYDIYRNLAKKYNIGLPYDSEYDEVQIKKREQAENFKEARRSRWMDLANRAYRLKLNSGNKAKLHEIVSLLNKASDLIEIREVQKEVFKEEMEK